MESKHDRIGNAHGKLPIINSIYDFSADALGQIRLWLEQNPPAVSISSIIGFSQFNPFVSQVNVSESTTSTTYVDLATVGPTISGLSTGNYLVLFGSTLSTPVGAAGIPLSSVTVNGSTPSDAVAVQGAQTGPGISGARGFFQKLSTPNSSLKVQYRSTDATSTAAFNSRWLVVIKYSNI